MNKMGEGTVGDMRGAGLRPRYLPVPRRRLTIRVLERIRVPESTCAPRTLGAVKHSGQERLATRARTRSASSGRTLRSRRRYSATAGSSAWAAARPQRSTNRLTSRRRQQPDDALHPPRAVDRGRRRDEPRGGDVRRRRAERAVGPVEDHRTVGGEHDVGGVEVEVDDGVWRTEAGLDARRRQLTDGHHGELAVHLRPRVGVAVDAPRLGLEVVEHRDARQALHDEVPLIGVEHLGHGIAVGAEMTHDRRFTLDDARIPVDPVPPQHPAAADVVDVGGPAGADQRARVRRARPSTPGGRRPTSC